jgi:hypothetical protein
MLGLPFICFCVPLAAGYGWSAVGPPFDPIVPPVPGTETYTGRRPSLPITMEYYGAGVAVLPFRAHLRAYLSNGDLPLWNPFAGIGQPLAAQGEGSPYSPIAVARALAPPRWANGITFGVFLLSALAQWCFLRQLGLSPQASALGGGAWALSGALVLHIPRDNLADQVAMVPPLFLAATWAVRSGRPLAYAAFALVTGLHGLAGFLPIALNGLLLLAGFLVVLGFTSADTLKTRARVVCRTVIACALGLALTGLHTLPIAEAWQAAHNKDFPFLAFIPMPTANVVSIFFPLLFGQPLDGWLAGPSSEVADWNNLFAYGSTGLLLLAGVGLTACRKQPRDQRLYFLFFLGGMVLFVARYISFPPVAAIDALPILTQLSPKHTNGVIVFCLVVTAAFGVEWLHRADVRRVTVLTLSILAMTASTVVTLMGRRGAALSVNLEAAALSVGFTVVILALVLGGLWRARSARTHADAVFIAAAVVLGELSVYLPLGNGDPMVLGARVAAFGLLLVAALSAVRGSEVLAGTSGLAALLVYVGVVVMPSDGLPSLQPPEPPPHLAWLRESGGSFRVFGIQPDHAGTAGIQDIEAVGPVATREYLTFVELISSPAVFETAYYGSTFSLLHPHRVAPLYDLKAEYARARPLLDWFGVRYIVLEHRVFGENAATVLGELLGQAPDLRVAYQDEWVTIVESPTAQAKAVFAVGARTVESWGLVVDLLRANPAAIAGPALVESSGDALRWDGGCSSDAAQLPVQLEAYRPNELHAVFDAPNGGVFVVKDSFFPGWQATLDGQPVEVVRVDGMVRGVVVPTRGRHEVVMRYQPVSFRLGIMLGGIAVIGLLVLSVAEYARSRGRLRIVRRRPAGRAAELHGEGADLSATPEARADLRE